MPPICQTAGLRQVSDGRRRYLSSDPNTPNYVKIGDTVAQGDTVCLIEAMKTFNPVKAHTAGKVTKILVESGDPVEYGEPLIVIE